MFLIDRLLLKYGRKKIGWIILIVLFQLLSLVVIRHFSFVFGDILSKETSFRLDEAFLACIGLAFSLLVLNLLQGELEYRLQASVRTTMRQELVQKVLKLNVGQLEEIGPTSSSTAILDAVEMAVPYVTTYLPSLIFSFVAPLYLFFQIKTFSLWIAVLLLASTILLLPFHNIFRKRIEQIRKKYWHSLETMTASYLDGLRGLLTLKIFHQVEQRERELDQLSTTLNEDIHSFMKINFTSFLVTEAWMYGSLVLLVWMSLNSSLSLAQRLSLFLLAYAYFGSVRNLMRSTHEALSALSASTKLQSLLEKQTEKEYPSVSYEERSGIELERVSFSYDNQRTILQEVSLIFPKNQVTALVGLSGSGKSTLASLLLRFLEPSSGQLYLDGKPYSSISEEEFRKQVTMVPQTVHLFSGTIRSNLCLSNGTLRDQELWEALERVKLADFIRSLDHQLEEEIGENGSRLSGGQKQKLGLARVLLSKAPYIVLDEATSAVDPKNEEDIWESIHSLFHERSLIVISHRLSTIQQADQIVVLKDARIKEIGSHEELMELNGLYAKLVVDQTLLERSLS